jgi:hypothetical protein
MTRPTGGGASLPSVAEVRRAIAELLPPEEDVEPRYIVEARALLARIPDDALLVTRDSMVDALRVTRWWTHASSQDPEDWSNGDLAAAIVARVLDPRP